jgi:hypothetical protein
MTVRPLPLTCHCVAIVFGRSPPGELLLNWQHKAHRRAAPKLVVGYRTNINGFIVDAFNRARVGFYCKVSRDSATVGAKAGAVSDLLPYLSFQSITSMASMADSD